VLVSHWNAPGVRPLDLTHGYVRAVRQSLEGPRPPRAVISYNDWPWTVAAGRFAQERYDVPWICIVADAPGPESGREYDAHVRRIGHAAGRVYLSWGRSEEAGGGPRIHLDGGVEGLRSRVASEPGAQEPPVVLFTGAMNRWAGASLLVQAFERLQHPTAELWLCGPGSNADVERATGNPRVRMLGLLDETTLQEVCGRATVFVNPRPTDLPENHSNFPSKVLEYLTYGKPVVSTWTAGLHPDFAAVLEVVEPSDPENLAAAMDAALHLTPAERDQRARRIEQFLVPGRLWHTQARRLLNWLRATDFLPEASPPATSDRHRRRA
jgi:glycosyltransferase involved in cell wall biosynthesis